MQQATRYVILSAVTAIWLGWAGFALILQNRFIHLLKTSHRPLWDSLWVSDAPRWLQLRYSRWFWAGGFDHIGDGEASRIGSRLYAATYILLVGLGIWAIVAWLLNFIELR